MAPATGPAVERWRTDGLASWQMLIKRTFFSIMKKSAVHELELAGIDLDVRGEESRAGARADLHSPSSFIRLPPALVAALHKFHTQISPPRLINRGLQIAAWSGISWSEGRAARCRAHPAA